jgi:hypothetical protein
MNWASTSWAKACSLMSARMAAISWAVTAGFREVGICQLRQWWLRSACPCRKSAWK